MKVKACGITFDVVGYEKYKDYIRNNKTASCIMIYCKDFMECKNCPFSGEKQKVEVINCK